MAAPINKWELWKDGSHRLTTKSNLLHLIVWQEGDGWHYRVAHIGGAQVRAPRNTCPSMKEAQRLCEKAARDFLKSVLKALEAIQ